MFTLFFFGLEICNEPEDGVEGQFCKKGTAKLSIYNIFFLAVISVVGLWYMWDALTARPLSQKARANSMRRGPSVRRQNSVKRGVNHGEDPTETAHSNEDEHNASNNNNTKSPKKGGAPRSPGGRNKSPVKNKNGKSQESVQTVKSGNGAAAASRSPRPGNKKRSSSANGARDNKLSASERSPRPGTTRSRSAGNVTKNNDNNANKSPRAARRPSSNGPSPRKPVPDFGGGGAGTKSPLSQSGRSTGTPRRKPRTPRGGAPNKKKSGGGMPQVPDL